MTGLRPRPRLPGQAFVGDAAAPFDDPAAVDDHRIGHGVELGVEVGELRPVGDDAGAVGALQGRRRRLGVLDVRVLGGHGVGRQRVVGDHLGALRPQPLDDGLGAGALDIVGAGLKCQPEDGDPLAIDVGVGVQKFQQSPGLAVIVANGCELDADGMTGLEAM